MASQVAANGSLNSPSTPTTMRERELAMRENNGAVSTSAKDPNQPLTGKQEHCETDVTLQKPT